MQNDNTPIVDPDGQPLMNGLSDLGMAPEDAYSIVQGVREMSGQRVIAEVRVQGAEVRAEGAQMRAQLAEMRALVAETNALVARTHAETRAEIAVLAASVDANTARINALDSRLDGMGWAVTATLALVVALAAAGLLNWMTGRWADSRSVRNESSG